MEVYVARNISFKQLVTIDDWKVKVYSILKEGDEIDEGFFQNIITELPSWLKKKNSFNPEHYHHAFIILHVGSEGIFSILNWWLDGYMLNTNIFLTPHNQLDQFKLISGDGLAPCVWELEVINFERVSYTNHVLKKYPQQDFDAYLNSTFNGLV